MLRTSTQAPIRQPIILVAAADSSVRAKRAAYAVCDGVDDQEKIQAAIDNATETGESVQLSPGEFVISDTILLKNGVHLVGQGIAATTIKAAEATLFPAVKIHDGVADARDRRAMIAPVTRGDNGTTQYIGVHRLTLDWNNCPANLRSPAPLWIDSCEDSHFSEVRIINAEPSDNTAGGAWRGHCISVTQSRRVLMERCVLTNAHYRSLGSAYGATDITFRDGSINTSNVWRHSVEVHGGPGTKYPRSGPFLFENNEVIYGGGGQTDVFSSHTGYGVTIRGNTFRVLDNGSSLKYVVKLFDGAQGNVVEGNTFILDGTYSDTFDIVSLNNRPVGGHDPTQRTRISGNQIVLTPQSLVTASEAMGFVNAVNTSSVHRDLIIASNQLRVSNIAGEFWIASIKADMVRIENNSLEHTGTLNGIQLLECGQADVRRNTAINPGGIAVGIRVENPDTLNRKIRVSNNDLGSGWDVADELVEITGNSGFPTVATATATVLSAESSVTIFHGLPGSRIAEVAVVPTLSLGDSSEWWTEAIDSESFRINLDQAPGTGGTAFKWTAQKYAGLSADAIANRYIKNVEAADEDTLEAGVKAAITTLVNDMLSRGLYDAMRSVLLLAGPRTLAGISVPLIGPAPTGIGNFVAGDYDRETGLKSDGGGDKNLVVPIAQNTTDRSNCHVSVYVTAAQTINVNGIYFGGPVFERVELARSGTSDKINYYLSSSSLSQRSTDDGSATGLIGATRNNTTQITARSGGTSEVLSSSAADITSVAQYRLFRRNNGQAPGDGRIAIATFGTHVNLEILDNIESAYMTAIANALS